MMSDEQEMMNLHHPNFTLDGGSLFALSRAHPTTFKNSANFLN
jgi:hypothetical protein